MEPRVIAVRRPSRAALYVRRFLWKAWVAFGCLLVFGAGRTPGFEEVRRLQAVVGWFVVILLPAAIGSLVRGLRARPVWRRRWWALASNWTGGVALLVSALAGLADPLTGAGLGLSPPVWPAPFELAMFLLTAREVRRELERADRELGPPPLPVPQS